MEFTSFQPRFNHPKRLLKNTGFKGASLSYSGGKPWARAGHSTVIPDISDSEEDSVSGTDEKTIRGPVSPQNALSTNSNSPSIRHRALSPTMFARTNPVHLTDADYAIHGFPRRLVTAASKYTEIPSDFGSVSSLDVESRPRSATPVSVKPVPSPRRQSLGRAHKILDSSTSSIPVSAKSKTAPLAETGHDSKLAAYTALFTVIAFISFYILPVVELFPMLLRSRMGPTAAVITIVFLSLSLGYHLGRFRVPYYLAWSRFSQSRTYPAVRSLFILLVVLYFGSFSTDWIFSLFFLLHTRVPFLGQVLVFSIMCWSSMLMCIVALYRSGGFAYSLTKSTYLYLFGAAKPRAVASAGGQPKAQSVSPLLDFGQPKKRIVLHRPRG
ncbi:hypothetical protein HDU91_003254 [Kappamyces sp. JEL0680]|nr:hypothetical protein HDU91_003254 [Kappamyces sp. JEL0680]